MAGMMVQCREITVPEFTRICDVAEASEGSISLSAMSADRISRRSGNGQRESVAAFLGGVASLTLSKRASRL